MSKELPVFEEWPFKVPSIKVAQKKLAAFTEELKNAKSEKEALAIVKKKAKWSDSMENEFTHISVLFSIDTKNKKYEKAMTRLMNDSPIYEAASLEFSKAMKESKFRPYLEEKLGSFIFQMIDFRLKSFDEKISCEAHT